MDRKGSKRKKESGGGYSCFLWAEHWWIPSHQNGWFIIHSCHIMKNADKKETHGILEEGVWCLCDCETRQRFDSICSILKNELCQWFNGRLWCLPSHCLTPRLSLSLSHFIFFTDSVQECPRNCHGNGECNSGVCHCFPGFHGMDCSKGISCLRMRFFRRSKDEKGKKICHFRCLIRWADTFQLRAKIKHKKKEKRIKSSKMVHGLRWSWDKMTDDEWQLP